MDLRRILARNAKRIRVAAFVSQEEVAERMGVDRAYISGVETARRNPTISTLQALAEALGVKAADLLREEDRGEPGRLP